MTESIEAFFAVASLAANPQSSIAPSAANNAIVRGVGATQPKQNTTTVSYNSSDVANLPLLLPFAFKNPPESIVIRAIMNEQHAADALANAMKREEALRNELQKAKSSGDHHHQQQENADVVVVVGGGGRKNASSHSGGGGGALLVAAKKNPKSRQPAGKSSAASSRIREIESQIEGATHAIAQIRARVSDSASWTRAMLQSEYSKRAVLLDTESRSFAELEEAFHFLVARVASSEAGHDEYYHEQRVMYVNEMLPVMKRVGERDARESLSALPYVQKFQADESMIDAMINEMHQLGITQGLRSRLEKRMGSDPAKFKVLKHAEEMLDRREIETGELVRKHYRKRSIKLHPDRNGERMRPIFEEFTDARNVLSDTKLRQNYLRHMLDVYKYYGTYQLQLPHQSLSDMMTEIHDAWNKRNRPDKAESKDGGGDGGGNRDKLLTLKGGLHQQMPRGVMLHQRRENRKTVVSFGVHALQPIFDFYARVRSVRVKMRSTSDETHKFLLSRSDIVKTIQFDKRGPILANEIVIVETALNPGNWEVFWYAELDTAGTDPLNPQNATENEVVVTRPSVKVSFEVVDHRHREQLEGFDRAENICKVVKAELSNTLHKLRTNQTDSVSMRTPLRYGYYHQVLVRARRKHSALHGFMMTTGRQSSVHTDLTKLLAESRQVFTELEGVADAAKNRQEKKDDGKRFKSYIASILEADYPLTWMKNVTSEELCREGGDVNRLYQLFIEGKGKFVLVFDSDMYNEASLREDLFSAKQRKDLAVKGGETAAIEANEEEETAAAEAKRQSEEEEREKLTKEADLRDNWSMVGHNATIHGLASEKGKSLNHQLAKIIYFVVDKDRFEVGLYNSNEKVLLKKVNLTLYYGHVPKSKLQLHQQSNDRIVFESERQLSSSSSLSPKVNPPSTVWSCDHCTFENDDSSTACSMCTTPKLKESKQEEPTETRKAEKEVRTALPHEQSAVPNIIEHDSAKVKKTIYVRSSYSKKLTGKRGRKKRELINKSGVADIHIETSAIGNQVPVHLIGTMDANLKAIALIHETVGVENVSGYFEKSPSVSTPPPSAPTPADSPPLEVTAPTSPAAALDAPGPIGNKSTAPADSYQTGINYSNPCIFSGFSNSFMNGMHVSVSGSDTEPASQFSFDDALLPRGLMDVSVTTPTASLLREVPSEIGIRSHVMTRETITVTEDGERSSTSKTSSDFTLNEKDPLLVFLRSQHQCIKGSVDEYYSWLVKSEDIDSIAALKEAVSDDEYLEDSMKVGCGSSGLKGFKRRAFQRAVLEYHEEQAEILSTKHNDSSPLRGMNGNPLLPANLFSDFDDPHSNSLSSNFRDPHSELVYPIRRVRY